MKNLNKVFILILLSFMGYGCSTIKPQNTLSGLEWKMPDKPIKYHVEFKQENDQIILTKDNSYNLLRNTDEKDAYINKLELLINEMKKYYRAK